MVRRAPVHLALAVDRTLRRRLIPLAVLVYLTVLLALSWAPLPGAEDPYNPAHPYVYATPFSTIGKALAAGVDSYKFAILVGNVVAFVPVGVLLPIWHPRLRRPLVHVLVVGFLLSVTIELVQLLASLVVGHLYRQADIDDVIANTSGAIAGYALLIVANTIQRALAATTRRE